MYVCRRSYTNKDVYLHEYIHTTISKGGLNFTIRHLVSDSNLTHAKYTTEMGIFQPLLFDVLLALTNLYLVYKYSLKWVGHPIKNIVSFNF